MGEGTSIFSGLEDLGFTDLNNVEVYKKHEKEKMHKEKPKITEDMLLYDKQVTCPVCENKFSARTVKTNGYRMKKKDSDFYIKYEIINPYFYDVLLCNVCGYAAMKSDFRKLRQFEIEIIQKNITPKWHGRKYPSIYDINIAIERYKLSLLNYSILDSRASKKAMNCLKLSWLYRELGDLKNEELFRKYAIIGLEDAYSNEGLPIYGMDSFTIMYLLGELNRRSGNYDEALKYLGNVITSRTANRKIKYMAITQKDLIKETLKNAETADDEAAEDTKADIKDKKKTGFFSKLFNS
ncbi:DUF2225 domain-containing protein [Clostridium neuense]|uniref:DUF2225 domain-containing protein n=1 Tax=Clostridium neuense TaxID=1728934 RepID=A0ABW8TCM0_9CLOT